MTAKTINLIYDGDCGFCERSLKFLRALDVYGLIRFRKSQDAATLVEFPGLRDADTAAAMYAVAAGELPQRGFFAFRRVLWSSPLLWPLLLVFYFPGASFAGPLVYAWVARNRKYFGRESDSCALTGGSSAPRQFEE